MRLQGASGSPALCAQLLATQHSSAHGPVGLFLISPVSAGFPAHSSHASIDKHASNLMTDILLLVNAANLKHFAQPMISALVRCEA